MSRNPYIEFEPTFADPEPTSSRGRKPPPKPIAISDKKRAYYRREPFQFCREVLGITPWGKQREILEAISRHRRIAVRSCNGAGKTFTAALAVLWWMYSYDDAIAITTAPTERQVKELLWREIRRMHLPRAEEIGGKMLMTRLEYDPQRYAYGFSTNTVERFQGFHSPNMLVVVDEASGVDEYVYDAIAGVVTTANGKMVMIGNPNNLAGEFFDAFHKNRHRYKTIHVSAFDLPGVQAAGLTAENVHLQEYDDSDNVASEDSDLVLTQDDHQADKIIPGLSTPQWVIEQFNLRGKESSIYQTRVLGEFPTVANDTLISLKNVESAIHRSVDVEKGAEKVMGVDIARFGEDRTVVIIRQGPEVQHIDAISRSNLMETVGFVIRTAKSHGVRKIILDEIGVGAGVVDRLNEIGGFEIIPFNSAKRSPDPERYVNARAHAFDGMRQRLEDGDISIPNDPELVSELAAITYRFTSRGQLQLESKDAMRARGMKSPDKADAFIIAFSEHVMPKQQTRLYITNEKSMNRMRDLRRRDPRWRY